MTDALELGIEGRGMLQFPCPLTPAATELIRYCLELSADLVRDDALGDEWATVYPRSARCLTRHQAREVFLDLLDKLPRPKDYVPTTYHWLLLYECLHLHIECLNDDLGPDFVESLQAWREARDTPYLRFRPGSQGRAGFYIDFEAFIEAYFWDTDFLLEPSTFYQLGAPSRQQLGYRADLFGVLSGLLPHPAELELKTVEEIEATEPEAEDGNGDR
jgi:hypothetical protein